MEGCENIFCDKHNTDHDMNCDSWDGTSAGPYSCEIYNRKKETVVFTMELEEHTPSDKLQACKECVLRAGIFMCLDRSYCKLHETGKTWKKKPNGRSKNETV